MFEWLTIYWDFSKGLDLGFFTLRYYSLLFAAGFLLGFQIMKKIFLRENRSEKELDSLLTYMIVATVIGARLGHVFFYGWDYYKDHPGEILKVWEGGLASHGAAIGIIAALYWFSKKVSKKSTLWILDRVVITVALAATLIRLGNFTNSEIYGKIGNSTFETVFEVPVKDAFKNYMGNYVNQVELTPTGNTMETDSLQYPEYLIEIELAENMDPVAFERNLKLEFRRWLNHRSPDDKNLFLPEELNFQNISTPDVSKVSFIGWAYPRYPTQLFESFAYLIIFLILFGLYWKTSAYQKEGLLFGLFLVMLFGFRFFIEFLKANQSNFEADMNYNMGQWLSIPLVLLGGFYIVKSLKQKDEK